MTKKIFAFLALSALVGALIVGCSPKAADDPTTPAKTDAMTKDSTPKDPAPAPPNGSMPDATKTK